MVAHHGELVIPTQAATDQEASELVRIWSSGGDQYVTLRVGVWADPAAWGLLLVDLAKHIANAYAQDQGLQPASVLNRIREGFEAEWSSPTDTPTGKIS
jgi:hypothetical protein